MTTKDAIKQHIVSVQARTEEKREELEHIRAENADLTNALDEAARIANKLRDKLTGIVQVRRERRESQDLQRASTPAPAPTNS